MSPANLIKQKLQSLANPIKAKSSARFFKTNTGQYGEGDTFLGISVPHIRKVAKDFQTIDLDQVKDLLYSPIHEVRYCGFEILVFQFGSSDSIIKKQICDFYITNSKQANNWDLVDTSAPYILGEFLLDKTDRSILTTLAKSTDLWQQRISIVATWMLIRNGQLDNTIKISKLLLDHKHDLIHKAVGWMLREVGKKDQVLLLNFLDKYKSQMARTTLRYAIERLSPELKKQYMAR